MTETSPLVTVTPEKIAKIGSCGVLLPNTQAKITDLETGEALGPNTRGELCVKGPQVSLSQF
jgi:long-subunit acyl-CoA synthetase (AMP-forming)